MTRILARFRPTVTLTAIGTLAAAAVALGATAPQTGSWHGTSGFKFKFQITEATCPAPPHNLTNPRARRGPEARGLCFESTDEPPIALKCQSPASISGTQMGIDSFQGIRFVNGRIHVKAYSYSSGPKPVGYDEISIIISGGRASGFVRQTDQVFSNGTPLTCDSGKLPFTAAHT